MNRLAKKIILVILYAFLMFFNTYAQNSTSSLLNYNWEENRSRIKLTSEDEHSPKVILFMKDIQEYVLENNEFVLYTLHHIITFVNTDDAVESSNKIILPLKNAKDLVNIKARSISKDGKIVELNKNNIKEIKDEENNKSSKIFAIEGVEKGCEIEYFYIKKSNAGLYGSHYFQFSSPVKEEYFELRAPEYLTFKFKCYNGSFKVADSLSNGTRIYYAALKNIPDLKDEVYANYQKNRFRLEYKFAFNSAKNKKEVNTWNDIAQILYPILNTVNNKEKKSVENVFDQLKIQQDATDEQKIHLIENYIKTNYSIQPSYDDESIFLDRTIQNKYSSKRGLLKLYVALLKLAHVNFQLVLTSDRNDIPFDGSFESYRFLNDHLIYFPSSNKFLTPEESNYRYPLIPYGLTFSDGLFLKEVAIGDYTSYIPSVKFIPPLDYSVTHHKIDAEVEFTADMEETLIKISNSMKGYYAVFVQPYYSLLSDDKKKQMLEGIMKDLTKDTQYTRLEAENTDPNSTLDQPFIVRAEVKGSALLEKAGNKRLLKIGEIIGKQMELYQDKQRKMSVEYDYNREYIRTVKVKIPDGYVVKNPDAINIYHVYEKNGEKVYLFTSSYHLEKNTIVIDIDEVYKEIACPVENYESYRKVVNAAADFNKVTLVFEPAK